MKYVQKQLPKSHKEHTTVHFAKGTEMDPKSSKSNPVNEIDENTNATGMENGNKVKRKIDVIFL